MKRTTEESEGREGRKRVQKIVREESAEESEGRERAKRVQKRVREEREGREYRRE